MNYKKIIYLNIVLLIDQLTKYLVQVNNINYVVINNFLSFKYEYNTGAAFSLLSGHRLLIIGITFVICLLIYHIMYSYKDNKLNSFIFGILYGGILGNLIDRMIYGYVRDFISFKFGSYYFPTFNIADITIVVAAIMLVIVTIKEEIDKRGNKSRRRSKRKTR